MSFGFGIGDFLAVIELAKKLRQDFIDAPSQFKDISTEVRSLSIVLQDIDAELSVPDLNAKQTNDLKEIVFGCRDVLEKLQRILSTYGEMKSDSSGVGKKVKRIWKRLQWEPEDIKELRSRIASNVTLLNTFQGKITSKILHEIKTNADQFYERQDIRELNKESSKILDWLTPIDYAPQQHDYINQRQQGTGQWLLDSPEFKQWVESDVQKLFCPGIPGAGKTILTSIVVEELTNRFENDKSVGIAYLYCNFRRHHEQKFDDLLSSLLKQLAAYQPSLPDDIINIYNKHKYGRTNPSPEEISKILQSVTALYSKVFIIVDALDECQMTDGSRERFLSELFNLQTTRQLSLFVTSRYVPEIKERFNDSLMLEIRANDQDVGRYLDGHISQLPGYVLRSSELQDEIKSEIIKAVDGMFLLARLHLQSLKGKRSPKVIRHALKRLPTGSNAYDYAYKDAMERIEGQLEDEKELAKQVLSWITCAKRPLTTTELQEAIAVEIDEPQLDKENFSEINAMISVCAGLVTVDDESDVVRLVHYTTQEYFERTHGDWFPDAETDITKTCITYLSFDNFGNGFCKRYWDFDDRVRSNQLFRYAAQNWGHHARKSSISDQTLHQAIIRFIESEAKVNASWQGLFAEKVFERYDSQLHRSRMKISRKVTAMHLAAYFGAETIVQLLLDIGEVDPNAKDGDADDDSDYDENEHNFRHRKKAPLSYAAENGHKMVVKLLLDTNKAEINSKDHQYGRTPFHYAVVKGHEAIVKLMLDTGNVEIDQPDNLSGQTPFSYAVENGYESIVKLLLDTGKVEIDSHDSNGQTPFSYAAEFGCESIVKLLLDIGKVEIDSHDNSDQTPFSYAVEKGYESIVKLLFDTGKVEIDSYDNSDRTPFSYAVEKGYESIVKLLIETGKVKVDLRNRYGQTPFSYAVEKGYESIVKLLLGTSKVEVDLRNRYGRTPFSYAVEKGYESIIQLLLDTGKIEIDLPNKHGETPFLYAAEMGNESILKLLFDTGKVDVDSHDCRFSRTPLSYAAQHGHESTVKFLLDTAKAQIDLSDRGGRTPLWWAVDSGYEAVAKLLVKEGADPDIVPSDESTDGSTDQPSIRELAALRGIMLD